MTDTAQAQKQFVITRNNVPLTLGLFKILKGKRADTQYPAPKVEVANLNTFIEWYGVSNIVSDLQTLLKRKFQGIYTDSLDATTGLFNEELFVKYATDLTSAGLKMKEINDKLDELQAQATAIIDGGTWETDEVVRAELKELNNQIKAYRQMREDRKRKPETEETDAEPSVAVN